MKKILSTVFYAITSCLWLMFFILLAINISQWFSGYTARDKAFYLVYLLCVLSAFILFAFKFARSLICVLKKPTEDSISHKEARAAAKTAKAEAEKQKRIEELEAKLHNLKKDE